MNFLNDYHQFLSKLTNIDISCNLCDKEFEKFLDVTTKFPKLDAIYLCSKNNHHDSKNVVIEAKYPNIKLIQVFL